MGVLARAKQYFMRRTAIALIELLLSASAKNFLYLVRLGERLTNDEEARMAISRIKSFLMDEGSPVRLLFERILSTLPRRNRLKLFRTFFNGAIFKGCERRDRFEERYGYRPPFLLIISPTMACNLNCEGCYAKSYKRVGLSFEEFDRVLIEAQEMGIGFVTILGGEPFVYPHLFPIIKKHPEVFFQIYTNGTLMDRKKARLLGKLGNTMVVSSIEGFEEETDARRGRGTFKKVMENMDMLAEARVLQGTSSTVTRHNVETISSDEFIDLVISKGSIVQNYFLYLPVSGEKDISLMVTPEQREYLRQRDMRIRDTKPIFIMDFWNDGPYVGGCIAGGRRYCHINAQGDIEPCVFTHFSVDNIRDKSLAEAFDSPLFREVRKRHPANDNHLLPCMIIDNPWIFREVVKLTGARPNHPGAETIITELSEQMDEYAMRYAEVAERTWREEYIAKGIGPYARQQFQEQALARGTPGEKPMAGSIFKSCLNC